jgi:hypothetical protein
MNKPKERKNEKNKVTFCAPAALFSKGSDFPCVQSFHEMSFQVSAAISNEPDFFINATNFSPFSNTIVSQKYQTKAHYYQCSVATRALHFEGHEGFSPSIVEPTKVCE